MCVGALFASIHILGVGEALKLMFAITAIALAALVSTFYVDIGAALGALAAVTAGLAYYALHSRRHLVANAPEEEFAQIQAAQSQLRS